jgi:hypothetical protein
MALKSSIKGPLTANPTEPGSGEELIRAKLNVETAKMAWSELQRFFAAGKILCVASGLDLIDVAFAFQQDNTGQVESWLQQLKVSPVSDTQARDWFNRDCSLWTVVVKPWVLVQDQS